MSDNLYHPNTTPVPLTPTKPRPVPRRDWLGKKIQGDPRDLVLFFRFSSRCLLDWAALWKIADRWRWCLESRLGVDTSYLKCGDFLVVPSLRERPEWSRDRLERNRQGKERRVGVSGSVEEAW